MMKALLLACFLLVPALVHCQQGSTVGVTLQPGPGNRRVTISSPECAVAMFCVRAPGSLSETVTLSAKTRDGTATAPADYGAIDEELTFTAREAARKCIKIDLVCDNTTERDQDFYLDVRSLTPGAYSEYRVDVTVVITEGPTQPSQPTQPTQPPRPSQPPQPSQLPRPSQPPQPSQPPRPTQPSRPSQPIRPSPPPPPPRPVITASASMEMFYYTTHEEAGQVEVCVIVTSLDNTSSLLTLSTKNSSAVAPGDFQEVIEELVFSSAGCSRQCVNIPIFREEREFYELSEYFFVLLTSYDSHVRVTRRYSIVEIRNANPSGSSKAVVTLEQSMYQVSTSEEGEVEVCAVLSGNLSYFEWRIGSLQTLSANSAVQARPGIDFELDFQLVYFGPGSLAGSKKCITISILREPDTDCGSLFNVRYNDYSFSSSAWPTSALIRITP